LPCTTGLLLKLKFRCAVSSALKSTARPSPHWGSNVLPLAFTPPPTTSTFIVDVSRAKVAIPLVFILKNLLLLTVRSIVAEDTAVTARPADPFADDWVLLNVVKFVPRGLPWTVRVRDPVLFRMSIRFSPYVPAALGKLKLEFVIELVP